MNDKPKARRGFGAMSLEKRTALARLGGAAVKAQNRSFARDPELAAAAGRRGGERSRGGGRVKATDQ